MNKNSLKKLIVLSASAVILVGCAKDNTESVFMGGTTNQASTIKPIDSYNTKEQKVYTDEGIDLQELATYESEDKLCKIIVYEDYCDITLDYERGSGYRVGAAYAETILKAFEQYEAAMEPYIFENIKSAFSEGEIDYLAIDKRVKCLYESLDEKYKEELDGYATTLSNGVHGIAEDGKISYEEALVVQMIPDALRPTACSALSLWGEKTKSGKPITLRSLEWNLGSENQMGNINAVTHFKNKDKTVTCIGMVGVLDAISAINDDGVFVAILDVGSVREEPYVCEGKKCYTFDIRHALEEYDNATAVGEYMVANSGDYTWCHNLIITDEKNSYCAEDCVREVQEKQEGYSILRDARTPLMEGLNWENKDSLCVVNSYASKGNQDSFDRAEANLVRFAKYNEWVKEVDCFSVADVKDLITREQVNQYDVFTVHRLGVVHIVVVDYATGMIQVAFTGEEGPVDKPDFVNVGHF